LKYKYRYIDRYKGDPSASGDSLSFGTYIHEIFQLGVNAKSEHELELIAEQIKAKHKISDSQKDRTKLCIRNFLNFNNMISKSETIGTEIEFRLEEEKSKIIFTGIIDRVLRSSTGTYMVIDYKTSKREKTKATLFHDPQLQGYCYAVAKEYKIPLEEVSKKIICAHYYPLTNNFVHISYTKPILLQHLGKIVETSWSIRKAKLDDLTPRRNEFCNNCEFRCLCPLYTDTVQINNRILLEESRKEKSH